MTAEIIRTIDQLDEDDRIKLFIRERNEMLRQLDVDYFDKFWSRWGNPTPDGGWQRGTEPHEDSRIIMMHKARLHVESMSADERAHSKTWLKKHGYTEDIGGYLPESYKYK